MRGHAGHAGYAGQTDCGGPARDLAAGQFAWQMTGDTQNLEQVYRTQLEAESDRKYINTEGSLWIDRVADGGGFETGDLQRARLGGIALGATASIRETR